MKFSQFFNSKNRYMYHILKYALIWLMHSNWVCGAFKNDSVYMDCILMVLLWLCGAKMKTNPDLTDEVLL